MGIFRGAEHGIGRRRGRSKAARCLTASMKACCCCWAGFWRILGLIFLFDCGVVGGPAVILKLPMRPPTEEQKGEGKQESEQDDQDGELPVEHHDTKTAGWVDSPPVAECAATIGHRATDPNSSESLYASFGFSLEDAFYQGLRREFCVLDEYLEVLLHFTFFSFFGMVWPLGCLFALMNYLLEFRFDCLKLGYVRRRGLPMRNGSLRHLVHVSTRIVAYISIIVQVVLLLFPYQQFVVWRPGRYKGLYLADYIGEIAAVGCVLILVLVLISWLCRALVARLSRWRRRRRSIAPVKHQGMKNTPGKRRAERFKRVASYLPERFRRGTRRNTPEPPPVIVVRQQESPSTTVQDS